MSRFQIQNSQQCRIRTFYILKENKLISKILLGFRVGRINKASLVIHSVALGPATF